jgi:biotin synthesis protein BioG
MLNTNLNIADKTLLVFYNGWGMDDHIINHLDTEEFDLITFNNYSELFSPRIEKFDKYPRKILIAWSFGVYMAAFHLQNVKFDFAIAVNGTLNPIDNLEGIAQEIFSATLQNLDETNLINFYKRCCMKKEITDFVLNNKPLRLLKDIKNELVYLHTMSLNNNKLSNIYNISFVGKQDRIFLPANQRNYWQDKAKIVEQPIPHYPFYGFKSWKELVDVATGK